jgi:predicted transcriptional regulator
MQSPLAGLFGHTNTAALRPLSGFKMTHRLASNEVEILNEDEPHIVVTLRIPDDSDFIDPLMSGAMTITDVQKMIATRRQLERECEKSERMTAKESGVTYEADRE